jgi:hypothetical protein
MFWFLKKKKKKEEEEYVNHIMHTMHELDSVCQLDNRQRGAHCFGFFLLSVVGRFSVLGQQSAPSSIIGPQLAPFWFID